MTAVGRRWLLGAAALAGVALLVWRWHAGGVAIFGVPDAVQLERAERATTRSGQARLKPSRIADEVPKTLGKTSADRLGDLYDKSGHPRLLASEAAGADDPVLWVRSFDLSLLCMHAKVATPVDDETMRKIVAEKQPPLDPAVAQALLEMPRRMHEAPARRLVLPDSWTQIIRNWFEKKPEVDAVAEFKQVDAALVAPASEVDRAARERRISALRAFCTSDESRMERFFDAYRRGNERWLAEGSTGAQLQNRAAGWTSASLSSLTDRDFELVERIVRERQPDGLARLLSSRNTLQLSLVSGLEQQEPRVQLASFGIAPMVATLAACELGVESCSANSPAFSQYCLDYGGCHLLDVASLARYVLARDGLDPDWIDREATRIVTAVWEGDLVALGIRRKP